MTQTDAGAVDVDDVAVQVQFPFTAKILSGKGLVELDQVKVGEGKTGPGKEMTDRRDGTQPHDGRDGSRRGLWP